MKTEAAVIFLMFYLIFPDSVCAHPGKTDLRGGHACRKGCSDWGLSYGEYHLHDEAFRPIRLGNATPPAIQPRVRPSTYSASVPSSGPPEKTGEAQWTTLRDIRTWQSFSAAASSEGPETASIYVDIFSVGPSVIAVSALLLLLLAILIYRRREKRR